MIGLNFLSSSASVGLPLCVCSSLSLHLYFISPFRKPPARMYSCILSIRTEQLCVPVGIPTCMKAVSEHNVWKIIRASFHQSVIMATALSHLLGIPFPSSLCC